MRYVDISYNWDICDKVKSVITSSKTKYGYFGNYYASIRDIKPLYDSFRKRNDENELTICGSSDIKLAPNNNISIFERVAPQIADDMESEMDVIVCILNKNCVQIPGKLFYKTCMQQIILVILDGKYQDTIKEDLERYNRFLFCKNNQDDITLAIDRIKKIRCEINTRAGGIAPAVMARQFMCEK